jgi:hypothetical protein
MPYRCIRIFYENKNLDPMNSDRSGKCGGMMRIAIQKYRFLLLITNESMSHFRKSKNLFTILFGSDAFFSVIA